MHSPTLTAVLPSSSEALLPPPCLLPMLMRLELRCICRVALDDLCNAPGGEAGGELAIVHWLPFAVNQTGRAVFSHGIVSSAPVYRQSCILHWNFNGIEWIVGNGRANRRCRELSHIGMMESAMQDLSRVTHAHVPTRGEEKPESRSAALRRIGSRMETLKGKWGGVWV